MRNFEYQIITDLQRNHYRLVCIGQQNETEILIVDELMEKGVKKEDIVLGFLPEQMRQFSKHAIN